MSNDDFEFSKWCGFCPNCNELKGDDYGQWQSDSEGLPVLKDGKVVIKRGCRDCGYTLTPIETLSETLPELLSDYLAALYDFKVEVVEPINGDESDG